MTVIELKTAAENNNQRLPCRGCTASCQYRKVCNGTPWRMESFLKPSEKKIIPQLVQSGLLSFKTYCRNGA